MLPDNYESWYMQDQNIAQKKNQNHIYYIEM